MIDHVDKAKRSDIMRSVKTKNGNLEILVRSALHRMGYRFRIHDRALPGSPDIVLPKWKTVVFVHGCYWHRHGCAKSTTPKSNVDFWTKKFLSNVSRDERNVKLLKDLGWTVVIVWQCEISDLEKTVSVLARSLPS